VPSKQAVIGYGARWDATKYYDVRIGYSRMFRHLRFRHKYGALAEQLGIPNANKRRRRAGLSTTYHGMTASGDGSGSLPEGQNTGSHQALMLGPQLA